MKTNFSQFFGGHFLYAANITYINTVHKNVYDVYLLQLICTPAHAAHPHVKRCVRPNKKSQKVMEKGQMKISGRVNKVLCQLRSPTQYYVYILYVYIYVPIYVPRRYNLEQSPVAGSLKRNNVFVVLFFFHFKRSYLEALDNLSCRYFICWYLCRHI